MLPLPGDPFSTAEQADYECKLTQRRLDALECKHLRGLHGCALGDEMFNAALDWMIEGTFLIAVQAFYATRCGLMTHLVFGPSFLGVLRATGQLPTINISSSLVLLAFSLVLLKGIVYPLGICKPPFCWYILVLDVSHEYV